MISYFIRIYLFLIILLFAGCAGGPKVDPPAFRNNEAAGSGGASMDAGVPQGPTGGATGNTGGQAAEDRNTSSDSDVSDTADDAGSLKEP
jgi:hypothetical protein